MVGRFISLIVLSAVIISDVAGNFTCICNQNTQQPFKIFDSTQAIIGYLNPNECKAFINKVETGLGWFQIEFNNTTGYVLEDDNVVMANCSETLPAPPATSGSTIPGTVSPGHLSLCPPYVVQGAKSSGCALTQHGHQCYEVCHTKISWAHAHQLCTERGGHLVSIHNAKENSYVHHLLQRLNFTHRVWIGLHDRDHEGHFIWTTGEKLSYTHWVHTKPTHGGQDCVVMLSSGQWDDEHCGGEDPNSEASDTTCPFICEYRTHNSGSFIIG